MSIKSLKCYIDTLTAKSISCETIKLDQLLKELCMVYMNIMIAEDLSERSRTKKHLFNFSYILYMLIRYNAGDYLL